MAVNNSRQAFTRAFWRGYGSALGLFPAPRQHRSRFVFRGRDLSQATVSDAMRQDWEFVGASIASALQEVEDERRVEQRSR